MRGIRDKASLWRGRDCIEAGDREQHESCVLLYSRDSVWRSTAQLSAGGGCALITPSAIQQWWQVKTAIVLAEVGGRWTASWGDDVDRPDYIGSAFIKEYQPFQRLTLSDYQYYSKNGPLPFELQTEVVFEIQPSDDGSLFTVTQTGFPTDLEADPFYNGCVQGWRTTLDNLKNYLEQNSQS